MNERGQYGAYRVGQTVIEPRFAALRRAVKAIFHLHDRTHAPLYVYAEVNGIISARPAQTPEEANALFAAFERTPGEVYVAVFAAASPYWPDPDHSVYHAAIPESAAHQNVVGADPKHPITVSNEAHRRLRVVMERMRRRQMPYEEDLKPLWAKIYREVWAEDDAGRLVLTTTLLAETDLQFWQDTRVKAARGPRWDEDWRKHGVHLDPNNPADAALIPIWQHIYQHLQTLEAAGAIVFAESSTVPSAARVRGSYGSPTVGLTLYHSVGDRADAVKQMDTDWNAIYQTLAGQVGDVANPTGGVMTTAIQKAREEELAAWKVVDSFGPLYNEVERIGKLLVASGMDKDLIQHWREDVEPPYAEITSFSGAVPALKNQFLDAKKALDTFMPKAQRYAANKRAMELTEKRGQVVMQSFDPKKVAWWQSYARPLIQQWVKFKHEQLGDRTVASDYIAFAERWQTNWDVYEDWKKKLDNLRTEAEKQGFKVNVPAATSLPTTVWADAGSALKEGAKDVGSGIGDVWKILKYGAWGLLGIGTLVAVSSVVSNLRSGKDPAEKYVGLIGGRKRAATPARRALPAADQLALEAGA